MTDTPQASDINDLRSAIAFLKTTPGHGKFSVY